MSLHSVQWDVSVKIKNREHYLNSLASIAVAAVEASSRLCLLKPVPENVLQDETRHRMASSGVDETSAYWWVFFVLFCFELFYFLKALS